MPRVVDIDISESAATLRAMLVKQKDLRRKEKIQVLYLLKSGQIQQVKDVAMAIGRGRATVNRWLDKYRKGGLELMLTAEKKRSGRRCSIPPEILNKLKEQLQAPNPAFNSYSDIQDWLQTQFQLQVSYAVIYQTVRYKLKIRLKGLRSR